MTEDLRILAVSAPEHVSGRLDPNKIYSRDPASLMNAMRVAAIESGNEESAWHHSNFAGSRKDRREKLSLMYSLDDMPAFEEQLRREKPHVLFIGAVTLALPGAVAIARKAREVLGDDVLIVLGGRHATETIYTETAPKEGLVQLGSASARAAPLMTRVMQHPGSPLALMQQGKIPEVFDLVVAGQGEYVISQLGEIANKAREAGDVRHIEPYLKDLKEAPGQWIAGYIKDRTVETITSKGKPVNYNGMASPPTLFGVRASFDVFKESPTAHVFSDLGMGCVYSCNFCSEAADVVGKPFDLKHAPERLYEQMKDAAKVMRQDYPDKKPTAFVEDSVFLGGNRQNIDRFCRMMKGEAVEDALDPGMVKQYEPVDITFGAQFTIDQIVENKDSIRQLKEVGLDYVFMGIETLRPEETVEGKIAKDTGAGKVEWAGRIEEALHFFNEDDVKIKSGAAIMFGLGEPHESRLELLDKLEEWQAISPDTLRPVSMNWAVQHPLKGKDGQQFDYAQWGTPENSAFLPYFTDFGEASIKYNLVGTEPPELHEVQEAYARVMRLRGDDRLRVEGAELSREDLKHARNPPFTTVGFPDLDSYNKAAGNAVSADAYYGVIGGPRTDKLASYIADLEGARYGYLVPSGQAAISQALSTLLNPGDHILVVDSAIYSTSKFFCDPQLARKMGVDVEYYTPRAGDDIRNHIKDNTRVIYMESPGSYTHEIQEVDAITSVAKEFPRITTVMDNTWSASTFFKPFEHGVDVSVVSLGKYHFGPEAVVMGAIVTNNKRLRDDIKGNALNIGMHVEPRAVAPAFAAVRTLEDRLKRQEENAHVISDVLASRPEIKEVMDPSRSSSPEHERWERDFTGRNSLLPFELQDGQPKGYAARVQDELAKQGVVRIGDGWGGSFSVITSFRPNEGRAPTRHTGECLRLYLGHDNPSAIGRHINKAFDNANRAGRKLS